MLQCKVSLALIMAPYSKRHFLVSGRVFRADFRGCAAARPRRWEAVASLLRSSQTAFSVFPVPHFCRPGTAVLEALCGVQGRLTARIQACARWPGDGFWRWSALSDFQGYKNHLGNHGLSRKSGWMPIGGARPGAGRPRGSKNKRRRPDPVELSGERGLTPLDYLLNLMRDESASPERRDWAADKAASYCHPRLNAFAVRNTASPVK